MISRKFDSNKYWEDRYKKGGNSGRGSYNELANYKADIINDFINKNNIKTLIDYGVGDGNQLKLIKCDMITGLDVSTTIINKLKNDFKNDKNKQFYLDKNFKLINHSELAISCDVLYHLIDFTIWDNYLFDLFTYSSKYVIIYASNEDKEYGGHCLSRNFTNYISKRFKNWKLINYIENKYKNAGPNKDSISDFYFYEKINTNENIINFVNDNNVSISIPNHKYSQEFYRRDNHEIYFRKIHTFLIKNKIIKNNIIDLGAYIGDNSIPWSKNTDSIIYAIDPSDENCNFINILTKLNNIENIKILKTAISDKNEILTSSYNNIHHTSFVYKKNKKKIKHSAKAVSLDYLYSNKEIDNIGYIHLDVEGMEFKVLKGSINIIKQFNPIISFEQHITVDNVLDLKKFLKDLKYHIFLIDEILPGCRDDCKNFIAFHNSIYTDTLIEDIHSNIGKNILLSQ